MPFLSEAERKAVLDLARQAVEEVVRSDRFPAEIPKTGIFESKRGAFVTLHVAKRLRGCIGVIEAKESLGQCIVHCAASAARDDPRFSRVREAELKNLEIEVSLLSPLERIQPDEIEIGKHGLLVEQGLYRGLLLPQVAMEHQLEREQFLRETCHKAGLPVDAWKESQTQIYRFTCEVFSTDETQARK